MKLPLELTDQQIQMLLQALSAEFDQACLNMAPGPDRDERIAKVNALKLKLDASQEKWNMSLIEHKMLSACLVAARAAGFDPYGVDDGGDEIEPCTTDLEVLRACDAVEQATVWFQSSTSRKRCALVFIMGNNEDCICDWTTTPGFDEAINSVSHENL